MLLPATDRAGALTAVQGLREAIARSPARFAGDHIELRFSVGLWCGVPGNKDSTASLRWRRPMRRFTRPRPPGATACTWWRWTQRVESGRRLNGQHHAVGNLYQHIVIAHAHPVAFLLRLWQALGFPVLDGFLVTLVLVWRFVTDLSARGLWVSGAVTLSSLDGAAVAANGRQGRAANSR